VGEGTGKGDGPHNANSWIRPLVQLRLLAVIEVLLHPSPYDKDSDGYYMPYKADKYLMLTDYNKFVSEVVKINLICNLAYVRQETLYFRL